MTARTSLRALQPSGPGPGSLERLAALAARLNDADQAPPEPVTGESAPSTVPDRPSLRSAPIEARALPAPARPSAAEPRRPSAERAVAERRGGWRHVVVYTLAALVWITIFSYGFPYYRLDPAARLRSPLHATFRPSGTVGLAAAYVGTALLLLLLLYSIRKRVRLLARLGALRRWLNVHVFCGILGPAFITLHSSFKVSGAIAIGYWSMMCVMASGFVGFYLYRQIPRALSGADQSAEALEVELAALDRELRERYGLTDAQIEWLRGRAQADRARTMGVLSSLVFLVVQDLRMRLGLMRLPFRSGARRTMAAREVRRMAKLARRRVLVERRRAFLRQSQTLFGYWHAIHKPFTIILFVMMGVHITVAIWLGYATPQP